MKHLLIMYAGGTAWRQHISRRAAIGVRSIALESLLGTPIAGGRAIISHGRPYSLTIADMIGLLFEELFLGKALARD